MKFQKSHENGIEYKLFILEDRKLEQAAKVLDDIGHIGQNQFAKTIANWVRGYRGLDYRECPWSEGCVDDQTCHVEDSDEAEV